MTTVQELLSQLYRLGFRLKAEGGTLVIDAPKGVLTPELRAELTFQKAELLAALQAQSARASDPAPIPVAPRNNPLPLSFSQQSMWLRTELHPDSAALHQQEMFRLQGELNVNALRGALRELVARHEILRARFERVDSELAQVIMDTPQVDIELSDLRSYAAAERGGEARRRARATAHRRFDLTSGRLLSILLLELAPTEHILLFTIHHMVIDGWSTTVLYEELARLYNGHRHGRAAALPAMPIQYADYAAWQRRNWDQCEADPDLAYWRAQLEAVPALCLTPERPHRPTTEAGTHFFSLAPELTRTLRDLSRAEGVTLFMTVLAAFQTWLGRYSGQEDFCVGVPVSGRDHPQSQGLIGPLANTVALRADLSGNPTFLELLRRVQDVVLQGFSHAAVPWDKLVRELRPESTDNQHAVFQALLAFQSHLTAPFELDGLNVTPMPVDRAATLFDVSMFIRPSADTLLCELSYDTGLFAPDTITRMADDFEMLLEGVAANPHASIDSFPLFARCESAGPRGAVVGNDATRAYGGAHEQLPRTPIGNTRPATRPPRGQRRPFEVAGSRTVLEAELLQIWREVLQRPDIGVNENFFALGGHSLLALDLMSRLHRLTGQHLAVATLFETPTVAAQAARLSSTALHSQGTSLIPMQPGGTRPPLILVPPAGSTALHFVHLVDRLGPDQPVYGLEPLGMDGLTEPHTTVEAMAEHYVAELMRVRPQGPHLLAGVCFGAHVAWEMARQLVDAGSPVSLVVLLDAGPPATGPTWHRQPASLRSVVRKIMRRLKQHRLSTLRWVVYRLKKRRQWRRLPVWVQNTHRAHRAARQSYCARPYHGRTALLQSAAHYRVGKTGVKRWRELVQGPWEHAVFEGTSHRDLLAGEAAPALAEKLAELCKRAGGCETRRLR